jgi:hypothetical protein
MMEEVGALLRPAAKADAVSGTQSAGLRWACRLGLVLLPVLLAFGFFYRPLWADGLPLPTGGDSDFYVYQTARMADLDGRWWQLGTDPLLGQPFPTMAAKHPGLYEGVDLLLVSAVSARVLHPVVNYHALIILVLAVNGWVAAWMVLHLTRSYGWAALAVVLVTLNMSNDLRVSEHLHLFRYGWILLTVWAFARYLDAPSRGRGMVLGLAAALLFASSFYLAFFLALGLGVWWAGLLVARRLRRAHYTAAVVAGLALGVVGGALTFPVWLGYNRGNPGAEEYVRRPPEDVWVYASDLWQYVVSPAWQLGGREIADGLLPIAPYAESDEVAALLINEVPTRAEEVNEPLARKPHEGWNYPGLVVLAAVVLYVVGRLRGWALCPADPRLLDCLMGLSAVMVILSLRGGPAVLLYGLAPPLRCYGRAGLIAVALWSVAAPVILCGVARSFPGQVGRAAVLVAALAVALYEGNQFKDRLFYARDKLHQEVPAWVGWLAEQPPDVRLAVYPVAATNPYNRDNPAQDDWHFLYYRTLHRHATLNGADLRLLRPELERRHARWQDLGPAGLPYMASLGYTTLAFQDDRDHQLPRWIDGRADLAEVAALDGWRIYRVKGGS